MPRLTSVASKILSAASSGAAANLTVSQYFLTLDNPNVSKDSSNDRFGYSVAISGNRAIVGAYLEDDNLPYGGAGKAYIIDITTGLVLHTLDDPNAYSFSQDDFFGHSVDIDGDRCIVGAYGEDGLEGSASGKAYIFNVTTGALIHTLDNPNAYGTGTDDNFGYQVAISGDRAIVAAPYEDDADSEISGASGKAYIFNVTTGALVHTLDNPNDYGTSATDQFGRSVDISGDRCIIGAVGEYDAGGRSGKAYIFNVTTGALVHTLNNPNAYNTSDGDEFGWAVAISGDRCIVGAFAEDETGPVFNSGKAYIFNVTTGALVHTLNNPNAYDTSSSDSFGYSVAISGDRCIVGAYREDDAGGLSSGKAYIFDVTTGALIHTLDNPNAYGTSAEDYFSTSVSISGDRCIVGAYQEDDAGGTSSGKAYTFDVTDGSLVHTLDNPNPYGSTYEDAFGWEVAISGNRCIIGAPGEDELGQASSGKAYIFDADSGSLLFTLDNPNAYNTSLGDSFGNGVDIDGDRAIVGAAGEDAASGASSGRVYVFDVTNGSLLQTIDNPNASLNDLFGSKLALSGDRAIVGVTNEGGINGGTAYIFDITNGSLVHTLVNPNDYGDINGDFFGVSVGISGDRCIVGARGEDDGNLAAQSESGKAYIFDVTTGSLLHTLDNPNPYGTAQQDRFGIAVDISGDRCIVGAPDEDDAVTGASSGKAYIFDVVTGALLHTLNNPNAYDTSFSDSFGYSVAIDGNRCIVGAWLEDDAGGSNSGKAYIFDVTDGSLLQILDNPNAFGTSVGDNFASANGSSVSISGDRCIVGAYQEDDAEGASSGKAYIFSNSISNVNEGSALGFAISSTGIPDNTTLYWTVSNEGDFSTSSGSFVINDNRSYFSVIPTADFLTEGTETFQAQVRTGSTSGPIVATSSEITINDTSLDPPNAWNIAVAVFEQSYSVSAQETNPLGFFFKPDGTKMYVTGDQGDDVNEYDLSTPWDISSGSVSFVQSKSIVSAGYNFFAGLFFKPDGTKMYSLANAGSNSGIHEYDLSTPWDVSTLTYLQRKLVDGQDTGPSGVFFQADGLTMYMIGAGNDRVYQYTLATAWSVTSATFSQFFSVSAQAGDPRGLWFKPDGAKMYITSADGANDAVHEYDLGTPWDVTSAVYLQSLPTGAQDSYATGPIFRSDGRRMYIAGLGGDQVYQYNL